MVGQLSALTILSFAVGVVQNRLHEPSMDNSRNLQNDSCPSGAKRPAEKIRAPLQVRIGHNWGLVDDNIKDHVRAIVSKANEIMLREVNFELVIDTFRPYVVPTCRNKERVLHDIRDRLATKENFIHLFSTKKCFAGGIAVIHEDEGPLCADRNCVGLSGIRPENFGSILSESDVGVFVHEIFHNLGAVHSLTGIMVKEVSSAGIETNFKSTTLDADNKCRLFHYLNLSKESDLITWPHEWRQ